MKPEIIKIDDQEYVKKDSIPSLKDNDDYCIIRTMSAGVHFGHLSESDLKIGMVKLTNSRRIWYWDGACSLSQLALEGVKAPDNCKFSVIVPEITILGVLEIIPCTTSAIKNISMVKIWKR